MRSRAHIVLPAIVAGIGVSALVQVLALLAQQQGFTLATRLLDWPNTLLQLITPCPQSGTDAARSCDGAPQNLWTYLASFPISAAVYSFIAFLHFRRKQRGA